MIFCVLGTHPDPFDRLVDLLLAARGDEGLVIQHGVTAPRPGEPHAEWHEFLPYEEVTRLMSEAGVVVCHAGVGTLMTAIGLGRRPVAVPRLRRLGEHVDDHQVQIARELDRAGYLVACPEGEDLGTAMARARGSAASPPPRRGDLVAAAVGAAGGDIAGVDRPA